MRPVVWSSLHLPMVSRVERRFVPLPNAWSPWMFVDGFTGIASTLKPFDQSS